MLLGFRTELKLNNQQRTQLKQCAGTARFAYNKGLAATKDILEWNKANPENKLKFPTGYELEKWFNNAVKPDYSWLQQYSSFIPAKALHAASDAWKRCFKKLGKQPRFKSRKSGDSFTIRGQNSIKVDHFKIKVPRIGWLKTYVRLPHGANPDSVTISRQADKWYISFKIEAPKYLDIPKTKECLGIDLGVKTFAVTSDSQYYDLPDQLKELETKIAKLQWRNRNKEKGSKNQQKYYDKLARLHARAARRRKEWLHKLTTSLCRSAQKIVIEDLNVSGMSANRKLAKAILRGGFYEFRRQLEYKAKRYGVDLIVADRFFASSKTCSNCGCKKETLTLSERIFECEHCLVSIDRDFNASRNLEKIGRLSTEFTLVDKKRPNALEEARRNFRVSV